MRKYLCDVTEDGKVYIGLLTLAQALLGVCGVLYALFLRNIINAAVSGEAVAFLLQMLFFVLLVCLQLGLKSMIRYLEEYTRSGMENRLKDRLFTTLMRKDYARVAATHSAEWMNRLTNDTVVVANALTEILPGLVGMTVKLVGAVGMLVFLEPKIICVILPGGLFMLIFSTAFRRRMKVLHGEVQEQDGVLRMHLQESLESMIVVRSYGVEQTIRQQTAEDMQVHQMKRMHKNRFSNICNLGFGIVMNGTYVMGAFFCGYGILQGTVSYGTFMAVMQLISQIQNPFANISGFLPKLYGMIASTERLMEAEDLPEENGTVFTLEEIKAFYETDFKGFALRDACYTYLPPAAEHEKTEMPIVVKDFHMEVKKGEYLVFSGDSGCGKSTVLKLLLCLYRLDSGERMLFTAKGTKVLDNRYRKLFAYVPQGNHLMSGTIREIVAFAEPGAMYEEERLHKALTIACADFVYELEKGVDTLLGEHGAGLSEGQMQRLAVARAIFSEHPILLLDEATSALDEATEERLLSNLRAMTDRTLILITHRPAAKKLCDREIVFDRLQA